MKTKNKYFIITIDTEADNQWDLDNKITTKNSHFLPRFQEFRYALLQSLRNSLQAFF